MRQVGNRADNLTLSGAANELAAGRLNNTGLVTLTPSATSTVVPRRGVREGDIIILVPQNATAAAVMGTTWAISTAHDTFTITHTSLASTTRTFAYIFFGVPPQ